MKDKDFEIRISKYLKSEPSLLQDYKKPYERK